MTSLSVDCAGSAVPGGGIEARVDLHRVGNRVFFAHDLALGWYGEPVVLVSPETGKSIRFSKLEIQLRFHTGDIDSWILRGADHPWELLIKADSDEICRRKV